MERMVDSRLTDRGRHIRISSNDRGGDRANPRARSICLRNATLFRAIPSEVAALNPRARTGAEVGSNIWEMETLVGGTRSDGLGVGRSCRRDSSILYRIAAHVASDSRTLFLVRRSHGDEDRQKREASRYDL